MFISSLILPTSNNLFIQAIQEGDCPITQPLKNHSGFHSEKFYKKLDFTVDTGVI
jgi:hypothetical protein